jgi:phospholipid-binding lipoprotein MlaA
LQTAFAEESLKYNPNDPYEDYNRHAYKMNKKLDQVIFRPAASLYKAATPTPLRKGINNFFSNLSQIPTVINDVLQGNLPRAGTDVARFAVNTTIGLCGFIDIATCMGLEKNPQDFGLTLAKWGYHCSNYVILPILGPSTVRDTINWPIY